MTYGDDTIAGAATFYPAFAKGINANHGFESASFLTNTGDEKENRWESPVGYDVLKVKPKEMLIAFRYYKYMYFKKEKKQIALKKKLTKYK